VCEALATLRDIYLGSFILDPEDRGLGLRAIWNFSKGQGSRNLYSVRGYKGPMKGLRDSGPQGLDPLF
jgi:hypothetical protein